MTRYGAWFVIACAWMVGLGCQPAGQVNTPANDSVTVSGRLLAVKDDRPADGGVDLTVETENGAQEILRVGSAFIAGPREPVLALHQVVDAAKVGDRLRASGKRDASGALIVERLEIVN